MGGFHSFSRRLFHSLLEFTLRTDKLSNKSKSKCSKHTVQQTPTANFSLTCKDALDVSWGRASQDRQLPTEKAQCPCLSKQFSGGFRSVLTLRYCVRRQARSQVHKSLLKNTKQQLNRAQH